MIILVDDTLFCVTIRFFRKPVPKIHYKAKDLLGDLSKNESDISSSARSLGLRAIEESWADTGIISVYSSPSWNSRLPSSY